MRSVSLAEAGHSGNGQKLLSSTPDGHRTVVYASDETLNPRRSMLICDILSNASISAPFCKISWPTAACGRRKKFIVNFSNVCFFTFFSHLF